MDNNGYMIKQKSNRFINSTYVPHILLGDRRVSNE